MKVQKAVLPHSGEITWLVLGDDYLPIEPVQSFLVYLNNLERSPNTVRAYAHHLKLFWEYLVERRLDWTSLGLNELAYFIGWLRDPQPQGVIAVHNRTAQRAETTVNSILASVKSFYYYQNQIGHAKQVALVTNTFQHGSKYKSFLHGIARSKPSPSGSLKLKAPKQLPKTITPDQAITLIEACLHLRDKFLISLLYETGLRIGQALGLRHADILSKEKVIRIIPRPDNVNAARAKTREQYPVDVSANLMRLYADYLVEEVQDFRSDYVFINLWREPIGQPMTIFAVEDLFRRLSRKTGIHITPHMLRHTHATDLIRSGWNMVYVQKRLGHQSIQTTINTYTHLMADDLKSAYKKYLETEKKHS